MGAGDTEFEALFDAEFDRCARVALRIVGDAEVARELSAEAFARAWSRWGRLRRGDAGAWVMRVTVNQAIDVVRRRRPAVQHPSGREEADDVVTRLALAVALRNLPKRQRDAVVLRYLADLPEPEVARALGVSCGTVKTHLHRGLAHLRASLGDAVPFEEAPHAVGP